MDKKNSMNLDEMEKVSGGCIILPPIIVSPDGKILNTEMQNSNDTPIIPGMPNPSADK